MIVQKGNRFARTILWRVRNPIGNAKVNVRTVKHWYLNCVKRDFHFLLTNNCQHIQMASFWSKDSVFSKFQNIRDPWMILPSPGWRETKETITLKTRLENGLF